MISWVTCTFCLSRCKAGKCLCNNGSNVLQCLKVSSLTEKDLMPIELADLIPDDSGIEQQSDYDSAADIELENLMILSLRMKLI